MIRKSTDPTSATEAATRCAAAPALEIHDMTVAYHRKPVLWDVDLVVPEGKLVGIVGPNGAGKTTLIKAVLGLLPLAIGWGEGGELQTPMARVVIGGLTTSTLITLVFIPVVYYTLETWRESRQGAARQEPFELEPVETTGD